MKLQIAHISKVTPSGFQFLPAVGALLEKTGAAGTLTVSPESQREVDKPAVVAPTVPGKDNRTGEGPTQPLMNPDPALNTADVRGSRRGRTCHTA